jgi:parallel beta-helix repeat protein/predicted outer membrane repeat protein
VASGTYLEHDILMKSGVVLRSETGRPDCVTIDGQELGRVFYCDNVDSAAAIVGFTITGGLLTAPDTPGAGIFCDSSYVRITDCAIVGNAATGPGADAGGIFLYESSPAITGCVIRDNTAADKAGGVYCRTFSSPVITDCVIAGNSAASWGGGVLGWQHARPSLAGCTLYGNSGSDAGGISSRNYSHVTATNTIIAFSPSEPSVFCETQSTITLTCSDVYGNSGGDWVGCIAGQYGVDGNFSGDPLFCDAAGGDFTIHSHSPCAPALSGGCGLIGALGVGCGRVWNVPLDAPSIQAGLDSALAPDTVVVACGTYYEHDITLKSGVVLRSETGLPDCVTIDAEQLGRVLWASGVEGSAIEGFTITGGLLTTADTPGAGVYASSCSLDIRDCVITGNATTGTGADGGGIFSLSSTLRITDTAISGNTAVERGGGIYCRNEPGPAFLRCSVDSNQAMYGGGIASYLSSPSIEDSRIMGNTSTYRGGGVSAEYSSPSLTTCRVIDNEAPSSGGGVYCTGGPLSVHKCTFSGNSGSPTDAGGISVYSSHAVVGYSIIAFSPSGRGVYCGSGATIWISCCDVYGNAGGDWIGCIADLSGRYGNFCADPLFCDRAAGDVRLFSNSPCLEASWCEEVGAEGQGCEIRVWRIRPDGSGDAPTIAAGIDSASAKDTVLVECGTYLEHDLSMKKGVTLRSETGCADCATIDADGLGRVIRCDNVDSTATIQGLTLTGGLLTGPSDGGAGIYLDSSEVRIADCAIVGNAATGLGADAGGIFCFYSSPRITDCVISGNTAADNAGGIFCRSSSSPLLEGCTIAGNTAAVFGGAVFAWGHSIPTITGSTLYGNAAPYGAGIMVEEFSGATVENSIIAFQVSGSAVRCGFGNVTLSCSDVYGNAGGDWIECIESQYGVDGNISADPLFCNPAGGDFTIDADSPCEPGHSGCGLIGALEVGCDQAGVGETGAQIPRAFYLAAPRPNPTSGGAEIRYGLPSRPNPCRVSIRVFDVTGRRVATLLDSEQAPGSYSLSWSGKTPEGGKVAGGVYFVRMVWNGESATRRLILLP